MDSSDVYSVVQRIPHGKVTTYGHIALLVNYPNNARQVGQILKHLPHSSSAEFNMDNVPWQRVISSQGIVPKRPGFENHVQVLAQEIDISESGRVDLSVHGWFPDEVPGL